MGSPDSKSSKASDFYDICLYCEEPPDYLCTYCGEAACAACIDDNVWASRGHYDEAQCHDWQPLK